MFGYQLLVQQLQTVDRVLAQGLNALEQAQTLLAEYYELYHLSVFW